MFSVHTFLSFTHIFFYRIICSLGLVLSRVHVCAMSFCVILSLWKDFFQLSLSLSLSVPYVFYFIFWQKKRRSFCIIFFLIWIYASVAGHWIIYRNVHSVFTFIRSFFRHSIPKSWFQKWKKKSWNSFRMQFANEKNYSGSFEHLSISNANQNEFATSIHLVLAVENDSHTIYSSLTLLLDVKH